MYFTKYFGRCRPSPTAPVSSELLFEVQMKQIQQFNTFRLHLLNMVLKETVADLTISVAPVSLEPLFKNPACCGE